MVYLHIVHQKKMSIFLHTCQISDYLHVYTSRICTTIAIQLFTAKIEDNKFMLYGLHNMLNDGK